MAAGSPFPECETMEFPKESARNLQILGQGLKPAKGELTVKIRSTFLGIFSLFAIAGCGDSNNDFNFNNQPPITPVGRVSTYLAVAGFDGGVGMYRVASGGDLSPVEGSPFPTAFGLNKAVPAPGSRFLYASASVEGALDGFSIEPSTGVLTRLPGFPLDSVEDNSPTFARSGRFLYLRGDTAVDGFSFNSNNGSLTRLPNFPVPIVGAQETSSDALSADGRHLYIADFDDSEIVTFTVDTENGALSQQTDQFSGASRPSAVELDPSGRYLYVAHEDGTLVGFEVQPDGALAALPGVAVSYATAPTYTYVMDFHDNVLYVGDSISGTLNAFTVGAGGSLTQVAGFPQATGGGAAVTSYPLPFTDLLYTSDFGGNRLNAFLVQADDTLTPVPGSPFPGGNQPAGISPVVVEY